MKNSVIIILFAAVIFCSSTAAQTKIHGVVTDENGDPLPSVNIYLSETYEGVSSNNEGNFSFTTSYNKPATINATMVGYSAFSKRIDLSKNEEEIILTISLAVATIEFDETVVLGSSFSSEKGKGLVISSMDVMTTPGGAADLFQSLKTMPGLTQVSESAQLYVRGGDPTETVTMIDQASIYHPYTYESSYGGLFSNLNTGIISEMYFSSGGFSAKYGNVLSGVLDIQTKDQPAQSGFALGISMAAASFDGQIPIVDNKLGVRFYSQQSYTKPIMWLNDGLDEFSVTPTSRNLTSSVNYNFSETGKIKFVAILAEDKQGVNVDRAEFDGVFNGNSKTNFFNLQLKELLGTRTLIKSSLSYSAHDNNWNFGALDLNKNDKAVKFRTDLEHTFSEDIQLLTGGEFETRRQTFIGSVPEEEYDIRPDAGKEILNERIDDNRFGGYAELKRLNLFGIESFYGIIGGRVDHFSKLNITHHDERIGLGYEFSDNTKLRAAFGTFHQIPDYRYYAEEDGNPNLTSMRAIHYVLSFDHKIDKDNSLRVEAYHKDYDNLPLEDIELNYNNNGFGYSTGLDLIYKGKLPFDLQGWVSYGFIDTKRKWLDNEKLTRSSFDITHNLSLILKYNFSAMWQVGINLKYATGRPYTPIVNSEYNSDYDVYKPVYASDNSARYPDYKRLDLRITHLNQLFGKVFSIFYLEALNILDIQNLFGYTYNRDYTEKQRVRSYFGRRTLVLGAVFTF